MINTRKTCPRIAEIESEIGKLSAELVALVGATDEEMSQSRQDVWEDFRETDCDMVSDLDAAVNLLEESELKEEMEEEGHDR